MTLHLQILAGQFVTFKLQAVVLSMQQIKLVFDVVTGVQDGEFYLLR